MAAKLGSTLSRPQIPISIAKLGYFHPKKIFREVLKLEVGVIFAQNIDTDVSLAPLSHLLLDPKRRICQSNRR
jgi:hypothetical protein